MGILQKKCVSCGNQTMAGGKCEECGKQRGLLQRSSSHHSEQSKVPPIVHQVLNSSGQPMDPATRAFFEPHYGEDFSWVRVHTDATAAKSAQAVNALAYTIGRDVVFGAEQYSPRSSAGQRLLAHELTHVVQQQQREPTSGRPILGDASIQHEQEAEQIAAGISIHDASSMTISQANTALARQEISGPMSLPEQQPMNMSPMPPSLRGEVALAIAIGEVGVRENPSGSNRGPCAPGATRGCVDAYTGGRAHPWCAHFVSWAFEQTGYSPFGHRAAVSGLRDWGRAQGWYFERSTVQEGIFTPLAGDIFTKPRYEGVGPQRRLVGGHTGFVVRYDPASQMLETVEGNTGDRVQMRTRSLNDLDGFIRVGS